MYDVLDSGSFLDKVLELGDMEAVEDSLPHTVLDCTGLSSMPVLDIQYFSDPGSSLPYPGLSLQSS